MQKVVFFCLSLLVVFFISTRCSAEGAFATGRADPRVWYRVVTNQDTVFEARNRVMALCQQQHRRCRVATTFRKSCIAVAYTWFRPGDHGYSWAVRRTAQEAEAAVIRSCRIRRARRCKLKGSYCDYKDEGEIAKQRRLEEERAAQDARRRRIEAEEAARRARRAEEHARQAEEEAKRRTLRLTSRETSASVPSQVSISPYAAIGFGIVALLSILGITVKRDLPKDVRIAIAIIVPIISFVIAYTIGINDKITLYELALFSFPFGGALVAALIYKVHS